MKNSHAPCREVPKGDSVQEHGALHDVLKWGKARAEAVRSKRGLGGEDRAYTVGLDGVPLNLSHWFGISRSEGSQ